VLPGFNSKVEIGSNELYGLSNVPSPLSSLLLSKKIAFLYKSSSFSLEDEEIDIVLELFEELKEEEVSTEQETSCAKHRIEIKQINLFIFCLLLSFFQFQKDNCSSKNNN